MRIIRWLVNRQQAALTVAGTTLLVTPLAACGSAGALAGDEGTEYTLLAGHQLAAGTPFDDGLHEFADLVEDKTDGRVGVEVYPAAQLGSETDMFENMRNGTMDVAVVAPGSIAEFVPELSILSMPFLVTTREHRDRVITSPVAEELEQLVQEETGNHTLTYFGGGIRQMFFTEPVENPEDLNDRLFRVQPSTVLTDTFSAVGLEPTVVAYDELYNALQQDVVAGADNEAVFIESEKFFEQAPQIYLTQHEVTVRPVMISGQTLEELPDDLRAQVLEAGQEAGEFERQAEAEADDAALQTLRETEGVTVTEADTEAMAEMVEPVWQRYAEEWGRQDMLAEIEAMGG